MPAEKSVSKASENRRSNKPLMEKRRRARINQSLTELKALILDAVKKDSSRHSKLEKADILEMTVKYLQNLQRQQRLANATSESNTTNRFRAGFGECASEVSRFLESADGFESAVRTRLLGHLNAYLNGLERPSSTSATSTPANGVSSTSSTVVSSAEPSPSASPSPPATERSPSASPPPSREREPSPTSTIDINNNHSTSTTASATKTCSVSTTTTTTTNDSVFSGLQLIPTRLSNGEIAFILPTHYAVAAAQALALGRIDALPVLPVSASLSENSRFTQTSNEPTRHMHGSSSPQGAEQHRDDDDEDPASPQQKQPLYVSLDDPVWRPW